MMRRRAAFAVGVAAVTLAFVVACYAPTEVRIEVTTDVPCGTTPPPNDLATGIFIGDSPEPTATVTSRCGESSAVANLGSLVVIPSDARDARVTVEVAMGTEGLSAESCHKRDKDGHVLPKCIVARRTFSFIKHTSRALPIKLSVECIGRTCLNPGETCNAGDCHPENVDDPAYCEDCAPGSGKPAVGADASSADAAVPDAAHGDGGSGDAAAAGSCTGMNGTDTLYNSDIFDQTGLLASSETHLFWPAPLATGGVGVRVLEKKTLKSRTIPIGAPSITALAFDGKFLLIGTPSQLLRTDLNGTIQQFASAAGVKAMVAGNGGTSYVATYAGTPEPPLFVAMASGGPMITALPNSRDGSALAVTSAYVYALSDANPQTLYQTAVDGTAVNPIAAPSTILSIAGGAGGGFAVLHGTAPGTGSTPDGIYRIVETTRTLVMRHPITNLQTLFVDSEVFFSTEAGDLFQMSTAATPTSGSPVAIAKGAFGALVADTACVYFWRNSPSTTSPHALGAVPRNAATK